MGETHSKSIEDETPEQAPTTGVPLLSEELADAKQARKNGMREMCEVLKPGYGFASRVYAMQSKAVIDEIEKESGLDEEEQELIRRIRELSNIVMERSRQLDQPSDALGMWFNMVWVWLFSDSGAVARGRPTVVSPAPAPPRPSTNGH